MTALLAAIYGIGAAITTAGVIIVAHRYPSEDDPGPATVTAAACVAGLIWPLLVIGVCQYALLALWVAHTGKRAQR